MMVPVIVCLLAGGCLFGLYLTVKGIICLFRSQLKTGLTYTVIGIPLFFVLAAVITLPAVTTCDVGPRPRERCVQNLKQIALACMFYANDHNEMFPTSFKQITNYLSESMTYVCPRSGHRAGAIAVVDDWTDYILVTNLTQTSPSHLILAYCKPENHMGSNGISGCNVLFVDGHVEWTDSSEFSNLTCNVASRSRANTGEPQLRRDY